MLLVTVSRHVKRYIKGLHEIDMLTNELVYNPAASSHDKNADNKVRFTRYIHTLLVIY